MKNRILNKIATFCMKYADYVSSSTFWEGCKKMRPFEIRLRAEQVEKYLEERR